MPQQKRQLTPLGGTIFFLALLNFAVFVIVALNIGGDAWNGKVVDGHYFVANHGHFTEVTPRVWTYSKWHAISIFFTHPIGIAAVVLLSRPHRTDYRIASRRNAPAR